MSELKSVRDTLLTIAHPDRVLAHADRLMGLLREHPDEFELPAAQGWLKPLLVFYTNDLAGWVKFVKHVMDRLAPEHKRGPFSEEYLGVRGFYNTVSVRYYVQRTRSIANAAVELAIRKGLIQDTKAARDRYAKRCTQVWAARKKLLLDNVRKESPTGRVSLDHREQILNDFWEQLDQEVNNGEIPPV
ncbi:MAG: hypothetical protein WBI41_05735 [Azovibrio sp.]|uniref:hypothetical protein n=1 Tax=Azovibrio sp. TaxID=1872673 RepID=UPI003C722900